MDRMVCIPSPSGQLAYSGESAEAPCTPDTPAKLRMRTDPATDIALIRARSDSNLPAATLGDSDALKVGQFALAIGNTLGLPGGTTASLNATIDTSAWSDGPNVVNIRAADSAGNWGPTTSVTVTIDHLGPTTTIDLPLDPNSVQRGSPVAIAGTASDVGRGDLNLAAAEWYLDSDPGIGLGTPMTASIGGFNASTEVISGTIPAGTTLGLSVGNHTLYVRSRDAVGNWTSPSASRTIVINSAPPLVVLASNFEGPTLVPPWSFVSGPSQLVQTPAAALGGSTGLSVTVKGTAQAGLTDLSPDNLSTYHARFYFDPNGARTGSGAQTIFRGVSSGSKALFQVQYRRYGHNYQARALLLLRNGKTLITSWYRIGNGKNVIEIAWKADTHGSLRLYINGTAKTTLLGNTRGQRLDRVRLGLMGPVPSHSAGVLYFDEFMSTVTQYIGK